MLHDLRAAGVIRAIGVGANEWQILERCVRDGDFDCFLLAGRYSLLEQTALDSFLPLCTRRGISVIVGGPFNSGILASGAVPGATYNYQPAPPAILERVRALERVVTAHGVPLATAALQFPFHHPAVATVIPGARAAAEVEQNLGLLALRDPAGGLARSEDRGPRPARRADSWMTVRGAAARRRPPALLASRAGRLRLADPGARPRSTGTSSPPISPRCSPAPGSTPPSSSRRRRRWPRRASCSSSPR